MSTDRHPHQESREEEKPKLTWREVFDCNHKAWPHMGACAAHAHGGGYEYFCWNGRIYTVYGSDTELLAKDIK